MTNDRVRLSMAVALATLMALALLAVPANAKTYTATGTAKSDPEVIFHAQIDAKAKQGKLKSASARISMRSSSFSRVFTSRRIRRGPACGSLTCDPLIGSPCDISQTVVGGVFIEIAEGREARIR